MATGSIHESVGPTPIVLPIGPKGEDGGAHESLVSMLHSLNTPGPYGVSCLLKCITPFLELDHRMGCGASEEHQTPRPLNMLGMLVDCPTPG